jgi:hypothetical protein
LDLRKYAGGGLDGAEVRRMLPTLGPWLLPRGRVLGEFDGCAGPGYGALEESGDVATVRHGQRCLAPPVAQVKVRPVLQQYLHDAAVAPFRGEVQRRVALEIRSADDARHAQRRRCIS